MTDAYELVQHLRASGAIPELAAALEVERRERDAATVWEVSWYDDARSPGDGWEPFAFQDGRYFWRRRVYP